MKDSESPLTTDVSTIDQSRRGDSVLSEHPSRSTSGKPIEIRRLNTIRGLAAFIVLAAHYPSGPGLLHRLFAGGAGQLGVMLFFLLSGFLMAHLYLGLPATKENLQKFAAARVARVLPLFVFVCMASFTLWKLAPKSIRYLLFPISSPGLLFSHLLFLYGTSVLWTIPPEIQFYILFALGWVLFQRRGRITVAVLITVLMVSSLVWGGYKGEIKMGTLRFSPVLMTTLPLFLIGTSLRRPYQLIDHLKPFQHHAFVAALLALPLLFPEVAAAVTGHTQGSWRDPLVILGVTSIFFALVLLVPDGNAILENRVGDFYGKISYSLYLLHPIVLLFMEQHGWANGFPGFLLFAAIATGIACLSFYFIEVPSRKFLRRVLSR